MIEPDKSFCAVAVWNAVFMDRPVLRWWDVFTTPGFRHVCAFGYSPDRGVWIVVDPGLGLMTIHVLNDAGFDKWFDARRALVTDILQMKAAPNAEMRNRFGHSCVTAIKQLIGLNSGAFTPKALHRHMTGKGAKPTMRCSDVIQIRGTERDQEAESGTQAH